MGLEIVLVATTILLGISGGFSTNAAVRITGIKGYKNDPQLEAAHRLLSGSAVATWIGIPLMIVVIILFATVLEGTGIAKYIAYGLLFITLILVVLVGILSAMGANDINRSDVNDNNGSFTSAVVAASLALGVIGIVLIVIITKTVLDSRKSKEVKEQEQREKIYKESQPGYQQPSGDINDFQSVQLAQRAYKHFKEGGEWKDLPRALSGKEVGTETPQLLKAGESEASKILPELEDIPGKVGPELGELEGLASVVPV